MKISPYKKYSIVNRLDNTSANAVSLVNYGANEQPFKIIKYNKNRNNSIEFFESVGDILMKVTPSKIVFGKDIYSNTEDIVKYLDEHNYSEYDIVETDNSFDVVSKTAVAEPNAEIELGEGITALIIDEDLMAVNKSEEVIESLDTVIEDSTSEEKVEKDVEVAPEELTTESIDKFDYWKAYSTVEDDTSPDLYTYLAAGVDQGAPPNFTTVSDVFLDFTIKCIVSNNTAQFEKNVTQYKEYMTKMYQVFTDAVAKASDSTAVATELNLSVDNMKTFDKALQDQADHYDSTIGEIQSNLELLKSISEKSTLELELVKEELAQFKKDLYEEAKHSIVQKRTVIDREVETTESAQVKKVEQKVHWKISPSGSWTIN